MSGNTRTTLGLVTASEYGVVYKPRVTGPIKRGILYVHGREADGTFGGLEWMRHTERAALINKLVQAGYTVLSCDLGGNVTWGNSTALARIDQAITYLLTLGVLPDRVNLVGTSMGACSSFNYARDSRVRVQSIVGALPVVNLTDIHDNRGFLAEVNAAYGGSYSEATNGNQSNPATFGAAGLLSNLPIQLWYGNTDTVSIPALVNNFVTAVNSTTGGNATLLALNGGHVELTYAQIVPATLLAFLAGAENVVPVIPAPVFRLIGNGANGSTSFVDSASGLPIVRNGSVSIVTDPSFAPNGAISFTGTGNYLSVSSIAALTMGIGDFTYRGWFRLTGGLTPNALVTTFTGSAPYTDGFKLYRDPTDIKIYHNSAERMSRGAMSLNVWHHIQIGRAGGIWYHFLDGATPANYIDSSNQSKGQLILGADESGGSPMIGYMTDFEVYKGRCLNTTAFTPPTRSA